MILFLDDRKLAADLRDGLVSEYAKFLYFIVSSIWLTITGSSFYIDLDYKPATPFHHLGDIAMIAVNIAGIMACHDINKAGDNRGFIERMICLGFPVSVRTLILNLVLTLPSVLAIKKLALPFTEGHVSVIAAVVGNIYFYWRLYRDFEICAPAKIEK